MGGESHAPPRRFTPGKETRYPLFRRLGGPQGRSGRERKISPSPGFDPRTVQPVASRYTDCAVPALIAGFSGGHINHSVAVKLRTRIRVYTTFPHKSYCSAVHFRRITSIHQPMNAHKISHKTILKHFKTLRHVRSCQIIIRALCSLLKLYYGIHIQFLFADEVLWQHIMLCGNVLWSSG